MYNLKLKKIDEKIAELSAKIRLSEYASGFLDGLLFVRSLLIRNL